MTLRLFLINVGRLPDNGPVRVEVDGRGLDIGRSENRGWTLHDPGRLLSGKHCEIEYKDGGYWLHDVSTNGTFINGETHRLAGPRRLHAGDRIAIGPYVIGVEIDEPASGESTVFARREDGHASPWHAAANVAGTEERNPFRPPKRKLAAILAADVVGFGKLAGLDEDRTLARMRSLRSDLIDPTIAVHGGRVVKRTGDGVLAEFRSVVDAVRCALEVQGGMFERNTGLPQDRRIEFRIGVHLGDVVEESDGDLMGDGVNIAARLEGVAQPGAINLSEDAYRQVRSRLEVAVNDLGQQRLKNVAEPVRVYAIEVARPATFAPAEEKTLALPGPRRSFLPLALAAAALVGLGVGSLAGWKLFVAPNRQTPLAAVGAPSEPPVEDMVRLADAAFDEKNYAEALARYRRRRDAAAPRRRRGSA